MLLHRSAGFTLIELLITAALIAFLVFATVPLTMNWVYRGHVKNAENAVSLAFSKAQTFAIKNSDLDTASGSAITTICITDYELQVRRAGGNRGGSDLGSAHCNKELGNTQILYRAKLADNIIFKGKTGSSSNTETSLNCICVGRDGFLTNEAQCHNCLARNDSKLSVIKGETYEDIMLY